MHQPMVPRNMDAMGHGLKQSERKERAVAPNFSDRVPLCFLADAQLRSNIPVGLLFCLFLLQLTPFKRTVEIRLGTSMINSIRPYMRCFDHDCEELWIHDWSQAMTLSGSTAGGSVVNMHVTSSFKTDSVRTHSKMLQPRFCV